MRAEINGKRWSPAAKATVLAAALGALAVVVVPVLPRLELHHFSNRCLQMGGRR